MPAVCGAQQRHKEQRFGQAAAEMWGQANKQRWVPHRAPKFHTECKGGSCATQRCVCSPRVSSEGPPSATPAREAVKSCVLWRMAAGGRALLQGHLARDRFLQQPLLWHCSPTPEPIMPMFSLSSTSSHWVQFSLFMRKALADLEVCVYTRKEEIYFLTFICIPQITKTLRFSKTCLEEEQGKFPDTL